VRFPGRDEPALDRVDLAIDRGSFVGLVGPSGAGKSTVLHLILRLLDPTEGSLHLDDADLGDVRIDTWRRSIGYVDQDGFIFNGSIRENIAFGRDTSDDEIRAAASAAHADEFIDRLPQRDATMVGDRGMTLSAGQRQRILIARALVGSPEILLIDEGTAALDARSEQAVRAALDRLRGRCTIIAVAHRLVTVSTADLIAVIDRGTVIDQGTPEQLRDRPGLYRELWRMQELERSPT
jgi:ABC-type multidrug transport system fused ATPase/permease subunit